MGLTELGVRFIATQLAYRSWLQVCIHTHPHTHARTHPHAPTRTRTHTHPHAVCDSFRVWLQAGWQHMRRSCADLRALKTRWMPRINARLHEQLEHIHGDV